jgi:hypothetical protein
LFEMEKRKMSVSGSDDDGGNEGGDYHWGGEYDESGVGMEADFDDPEDGDGLDSEYQGYDNDEYDDEEGDYGEDNDDNDYESYPRYHRDSDLQEDDEQQEIVPQIFSLATGLSEDESDELSDENKEEESDNHKEQEVFFRSDEEEFDWENIELYSSSKIDELKNYITNHFPEATFPESEDEISLGNPSSLNLYDHFPSDEMSGDQLDEELDSDEEDDEEIEFEYPTHQQRGGNLDVEEANDLLSSQTQKKRSGGPKKAPPRGGARGNGRHGGGGGGKGKHGKNSKKQSTSVTNASLREVERRHKVSEMRISPLEFSFPLPPLLSSLALAPGTC